MRIEVGPLDTKSCKSKRMLREKIRSLLRKKYPSFYKLLKILKGESHKLILIDYPMTLTPRYGYGKPPHSLLHTIIDKEREAYKRTLKSFLAFKHDLLQIPLKSPSTSHEPCWINGWLPGLDAVALYSFLRQNRPKRYFEVGSGSSTKFARRAILDGGLPTSITAIDPTPREDIDSVSDTLIRNFLEKVDVRIFHQLKAGDILFIDSSHWCFMNSDVTVTFLDVLPQLSSGVLVHFHDIYLPYDYPLKIKDQFYSEQYLLGLYLLLATKKVQIVLPNTFISRDPELRHILDPLWKDAKMKGVEVHGGSFWMKMK